MSKDSNRLVLDEASYSICVFFSALSHNYFHILNPNLEFLQVLHFIFNQNNHFMFQLLKVGVVQYFHSYLLVFGFLRKILEQRTGSFSLVLKRSFSHFPIQQPCLMSDLNIFCLIEVVFLLPPRIKLYWNQICKHVLRVVGILGLSCFHPSL